MKSNEVYEYQFENLYRRLQSEFNKPAIVEEKDELSSVIGEKSCLLFDIAGHDFSHLKALESEYRYWVEAAIYKIVINLLNKRHISFEEHYYGDGNEQHSIRLSHNGRAIEVFFLFDITDEQERSTDYDKIASSLIKKVNNVESIELYILRSFISYFDLAGLFNSSKKMNLDGFVVAKPLRDFFMTYFEQEEYDCFSQYASSFCERCNSVVGYKTVITPTSATMRVFKNKKIEMLKQLDYRSLEQCITEVELSENDYSKLTENFITNNYCSAMISDNDFADSFISAEWLYDVYNNSMGELELTGIIAGYLKSIEQLLFSITRFHINEGVRIKTSDGYYKEYSDETEAIIDSTLASLNAFVTSKYGKFAETGSIRKNIYSAIDKWRKYQRNGYFHKHNLHLKDNKIDEVRTQTFFLYYLILGGVKFSKSDIEQLGIKRSDSIQDYQIVTFDFYNEYKRFSSWMMNLLRFDLPVDVGGVYILPIDSNDKCQVNAYCLKNFDQLKINSDEYNIDDFVDRNHVHDIPCFSWTTNSFEESKNEFTRLLTKFRLDNDNIHLPSILWGDIKKSEIL